MGAEICIHFDVCPWRRGCFCRSVRIIRLCCLEPENKNSTMVSMHSDLLPVSDPDTIQKVSGVYPTSQNTQHESDIVIRYQAVSYRSLATRTSREKECRARAIHQLRELRDKFRKLPYDDQITNEWNDRLLGTKSEHETERKCWLQTCGAHSPKAVISFPFCPSLYAGEKERGRWTCLWSFNVTVDSQKTIYATDFLGFTFCVLCCNENSQIPFFKQCQ